MEKIWIDAAQFKNPGGWQLETQFVREMGCAYLIANDIPGVPVENAITDFETREEGYYRIFVRTKNWKLPEAPGQFSVEVNGKELANICGKMPTPSWYWEIAGDIELEKGCHTISLKDKTGWLSRCANIVITNDFNFVPSPEINRMFKQRAEIKNINFNDIKSYEFDFAVIGAGPGGVPAAISAARNGLKTALISGRPSVGGNASNEGTVGSDGAGAHHKGMHETGIINEIRAVRNHFKMSWQDAMNYLLKREKNITVFSDTLCIDAVCENNTIISAECINTVTLEKSSFKAKFFADCSGDGWLGYYAGAAYRLGREAWHEYGEALAPENPDTLSMSGCICGYDKKHPKIRSFRAVDEGKPVKFNTPDWAIKFPKEIHRKPTSFAQADWWLENSNDYDDLWEAEFARDEMVRIAVGYFGWLKNSYEKSNEAENYRLDSIGLHNSKRENRRLIGDYVLNQNDFVENTHFDDAIAYSGWAIDVHNIKGIYSGEEGVFHKNILVPIVPIPYRTIYSLNINNLFMAARCASFSHLALGSTRVEATLSTLGQAAGVAAAMCVKLNETPRGIYQRHIKALQQALLYDDQTVLGIKNEDSNDLARTAEVTASSYSKTEGSSNLPQNVINGIFRPDETSNNAWVSDEKQALPASITLTLKKESDISLIQITADTDLTYPRMAYHDVPVFEDTARDLTVEVLSKGEWITVGTAKDNFVRQMRFAFDKVSAKAVRVTVTATSGSKSAKLNEIRIY